jgi:hypothetical protein
MNYPPPPLRSHAVRRMPEVSKKTANRGVYRIKKKKIKYALNIAKYCKIILYIQGWKYLKKGVYLKLKDSSKNQTIFLPYIKWI